MAETKVSDDFESFYTREQEAIEKVKHEEARTADVPLEIGTKGICVVTDMSFASTPKQTDEKGVITKEACPYCRIGYRVIDNAEHEGKRLQQTFFFWKNATTTRAETFKQFLDALENNHGLPREVRENHSHPRELGQWFQNNEHTIHFEVQADKPTQYNDGKRLRLSIPKDVVPMTSDVAPPARGSSVSTAGTETSVADPANKPFVVGELVIYMEEPCKVVEIFDTKVQVKGVDNPSFEKVALKTAVTRS